MSRYVFLARSLKTCFCSEYEGSITNVLRSSHQNLETSVSKLTDQSLRQKLPFSRWIFSQTVSDCVHLFPAFPPLVGVSFLCAHIYNLQIVSPFLGVLFLILDAVSFNGPFSWTLPFHHPSALVCSQDDYKVTPATKYWRSSIHLMQSCGLSQW